MELLRAIARVIRRRRYHGRWRGPSDAELAAAFETVRRDAE